MKKILQSQDHGGEPLIGGLGQSDTINAMHFTGAAAKSATVPTGARYVVFGVSGNADIYVKIGGTAAVLTGDVTNGSASELNPLIRNIGEATSIGVAVSAACDVTLAYYS